MDPDSLDWIWQDLAAADSAKEPKEPVGDGSDDDDYDYDSDDSDFRGSGDEGHGSGDDDVSTDSTVGYTSAVTDANAMRELREFVDDAERELLSVSFEDDADVDGESASAIGAEDLDEADYESVYGFYVDAVDAVERKLSRVRLVWADAVHRCTTDEKNVPDSFVKTTNIEKLVLLYASNFIEQFKMKYPNRRPLSLVLENECGVQKCVCTTIKPSRLVYHDLNDLISYSEFVANFITYVKLDDPTVVPKKIVSPSTTLEKQTANCFELAILLASFLIGFGYNAFVVQGYATESVCNNDLSRIKLDMSKYDTEPIKFDESDDVKDVNDIHEVDLEIDMCSEFVNFLIEEEKKKSFVEDEVKENNLDHSIDPLYGRRVHCWVMIIPLKVEDEQTANDPYFIEPSVGEKKKVSDDSYIGIESIWNHKNYWINIQPLNDGCTEYDFDLTNKTCWEQFLSDETQNFQGSTLEMSRNENESSRNVIMPNSWVSVLEVPRNRYFMLYPMGKKITRYMNALKESYAEYISPDGLMETITFYAEPEYKYKIFVRELYRHRVDKLISLEMRFSDNRSEAVEYFSSGRKDCLKMHKFSGNINSLDTERLFEFYNLRLDSMIKLEIDPNSFITTFNDRSDLLFWRTSEFEKSENVDGQVINSKRKPTLIIEKYLRDESKHKDRDIATIHFYIVLNNIYVQYQYGEGQITQSKRIFEKPTVADYKDFDPASVTENIVYPYEGHLEPYESYMLLQEMIEAEIEAIRAISKLEDEVIGILESRSRERSECKLKINSLDWDRNRKTRKLLQIKKDKKLTIIEREEVGKTDYALPYLQLGKTVYTYEQIFKIRDKVVRKFRKNTNNQFIQAKNSFLKKESKMRSMMMALEKDNLEAAFKNKMLMLCLSLKNELEVLTMKMQRYKEIRAERYNNLVSYLNSKPEFKTLPPLKLLNSNGT